MSISLNFSDSIHTNYVKEDPKTNCPSVTFQVTDDCCLQCSYCYQTHKGHAMMSNETMKSCIDLLFKMYDDDKEDTFINKHTKGIILEFMGGEPFMNVDAMSYGSQYFIDECIKRDHIWLTNFRFSISTNGVLYFEDKVQEYLKKFFPFINLNITIDGPKELHDSCRKDYEGNGSFDRAIAALRDWKQRAAMPSTKVTIAPENLPYLHLIAKFFMDEGCTEIFANPIYEHEWTIEEAKVYYQQLKQIADEFLKDLNIGTNIFTPMSGIPLMTSENRNWCGGTGKMLTFGCDGKAYPCVRYMKSSLGTDQPPMIIGDTTGIYNTNEYKEIQNNLLAITRRSQSTDECFNCHIAGGCAWCSAWNYQCYGTPNKRSTNICWMHRARSLANTYYLNLYYIKTHSTKRMPVYLERSIATQIIDNDEYDKLLKLSFN